MTRYVFNYAEVHVDYKDRLLKRSTTTVLFCKKTPHDRCHLVQRQPLSENHMISAILK